MECHRIRHRRGADEIVVDETGAARPGEMPNDGEVNGGIAGESLDKHRPSPYPQGNEALRGNRHHADQQQIRERHTVPFDRLTEFPIPLDN